MAKALIIDALYFRGVGGHPSVPTPSLFVREITLQMRKQVQKDYVTFLYWSSPYFARDRHLSETSFSKQKRMVWHK